MFAVVLLALLISVPVRAELRDPNNSADYIILTNQEVLSNNSWIDSLLDYRAAQGRVSMAVTVEEIWAEFTPAGSDSAIREFLHYAYDNWQTPHLKDVFIVGHWDVVPSAVLVANFDTTAYHSDYLFSVPISSDDYSPRFAIGRLPWSPRYNVALNNFANKIDSYELAQTGQWTNRCHLIADSICGFDDCEYFFEQHIVEGIPEGVVIQRDYFSRPVGDPWSGDREEVLQNLNEGSLFTCYYGHSSSTEILPADPITSDNFALLTNNNQLTIFSGLVVLALGIDTSNAIPLHFAALNNADGGAIASIGHTGIPWAIAGSVYNRRVMNEVFLETNVTLSDAWLQTCSYFADSILNGQFNSSSAWVMLLGNHLLGDPATIIPGHLTSADPISAPLIPATIQIVGNYPNPFNPSTTINFMLNRSGSARLTVYDVTGRAVTTLAEQNFTAGSHSIVWNAAGLASGIYLVRLESAGQFDTHKITLLK